MTPKATHSLPTVALLAGGLAKRLRPITETIPKALIEIKGRPFISYQMDQLKKEGISEVVCCVGYKGEMIEKTLGNGSQFGLNIHYSYDGEKLLGTGGAIKKVVNKLGPEFFILYGDSFLQVNYSDVKQTLDQSGKKGVLTIMENRGRWDISNVHFTDNRLVAYSKKKLTPEMAFIDYGLSLVKKETFSNAPENEYFDLADLYESLACSNELVAFIVNKRFYEIGSPQGLEEFEKEVHRGFHAL